jgi:bifunctional non-homologous end joining protein LigD
MGLEEYQRKRDFRVTREPAGKVKQRRGKLSFVVQHHFARSEHFDFRLELDGVLKSWAVPKEPSSTPGERRLAVRVEDHPIEYAQFEGTIPPGSYGAGTVERWDGGTWEPEGDPHEGLREGKLEFILKGRKLKGAWVMVRMGRDAGRSRKVNWLLIKRNEPATGESRNRKKKST